MSVFRMNNAILRSCAMYSAIHLRNCKNSTGIFPAPVYFLQKCYQTSSTRDVSNLIDINLNEDFDFESESPYSNFDFESISDGDAEKLRAFKVLQLEVDLMRQQGEKVPIHLNGKRWKDLLNTPSECRPKYLQNLWMIEMKVKHEKEEAKKRYEVYLELKAKKKEAGPKRATTSSPIEYSLTGTSLFHRVYETTIHRFYHYKLLQAEWFGPKVIVDCSYESYMNPRNLNYCVKQMIAMWTENRENYNPYDIVFCNVDKEGTLWHKFFQRMSAIDDIDCPVHFTNKHYLDIFPRNKLVYLTPDSLETLHEFNPDDIYIIGAYVDTGNFYPVSRAKAKKDGLRMAKLPLDRHLHWVTGHKILALNQVMAILNDVKDGQSWGQAFKHVPTKNIGSSTLNDREEDERPNPLTAKTIRENFRKNIVYDLLFQNRPDSSKS